jgi:hypothetical protein
MYERNFRRVLYGVLMVPLTSKNLYTQLVTILGLTKDGWTFPLVYVLLPDTKASIYKYLFEEFCRNEYGAILRLDIVLQ